MGTDYDVITIGDGLADSTLAKVLAEAGRVAGPLIVLREPRIFSQQARE
jgi:hypothetical protein